MDTAELCVRYSHHLEHYFCLCRRGLFFLSGSSIPLHYTGRNSVCQRYLLVFYCRPHAKRSALTNPNHNHKPQTTINHGALADRHPSAARMQRVRLLHRRMAALSIAHRLRNTPTATIGTRCPVSGSKEPAEQRCISCFR